MGQEIEKRDFTDQDYRLFSEQLKKETSLLKKWYDERKFEFIENPNIGLEVEGWIVDENGLPTPEAQSLLDQANDKHLVGELSQFNFELNADHCQLDSNCFSKMEDHVADLMTSIQKVARSQNNDLLLIGIAPMVRDEMLQLPYITDSNRYHALNDQLLRLREYKPVELCIEGADELKVTHNDLMLEAGTTSMQIHLQVNQENILRYYNGSLIASAPCLAIGANSPFLFGKSLWAETRIPLFEQAISMTAFRDKKGENVGQVCLGTGYCRHSILEPFLENLSGFQSILPITMDESPDQMKHLSLHNGTIWRWIRPIVGTSKKHPPHIRLEQRIFPSGPTPIDMMANMAFYIGLTHYFATRPKAPEESMTFTDCKNNFYACAKDGLKAKVRWFGKEKPIQEVVYNDLVPQAKIGLKEAGISEKEIKKYLDDIILPRVRNGQNGCQWQRSYINLNGPDFQGMTQKYLENQITNTPVHLWKL